MYTVRCIIERERRPPYTIHSEQNYGINDTTKQMSCMREASQLTHKGKKIIWVSHYFHCHCVKYSQIILLEKADTKIHEQKSPEGENVYLNFYTQDKLQFLCNLTVMVSQPFVSLGHLINTDFIIWVSFNNYISQSVDMWYCIHLTKRSLWNLILQT